MAACAVEEVSVMVRGESENPTKMNIQAGKFKMVIDEPAQMGGSDEGPSPVQVLLMSLAGCLNVTGHEVARQRNLQLNSIKLSISGVMNPCTFLGCSFDERAGFQKIQVVLKPDFIDASEEEIRSWMEETERRCPVTDNIRAGTTMDVSVAH